MRTKHRTGYKALMSLVAMATGALLLVPATASAAGSCPDVTLNTPATVVMAGTEGTVVTFTGATPATCDLTDTLDAIKVSGNQPLTVNLSGGPFENSDHDDLVFDLTNHVGTLTVNGTSGNDRISMGTEGVNLDSSSDVELFFGSPPVPPTSLTINGLNGSDTMRADGSRAGNPLAMAVTMNGGSGNDRLTGGDANDTLNGDGNNDTIIGGLGSDTENGGSGKDRFDEGDTAQSTVVTPGSMTFYSLPADGFVQSSATATGGTCPGSCSAAALTAAYNSTRAGTPPATLSLNPEGGGVSMIIGQARENNGFTAREAFVSFNTEPLPNGVSIDSVNFSLFGVGGGPSVPITIEARAKAWTPLATGDWVAGASLDTTVPELATANVAASAVGAYNFTESGSAFRDFINDSGTTEFMLNGNTHRTGPEPGNLVYQRTSVATAESAVGPEGTDQDPKLVVNYSTTAAGSPDTIIGGSGTDSVEYTDRTNAVVVDLNGGAVSGETNENDTITGVENAEGGSGGDTLIGNSSKNLLQGGDGIDTLNGNSGDDKLEGGDGGDTENGGLGNDTFLQERDINGGDILDGDGGKDTASYTGRSSNVIVTVNGTDDDDGEATEGDTVTDMEKVFGGRENDTFTGSPGTKYELRGNSGDDDLTGADLNDRLYGGGGEDDLTGLGGTDYASGGSGDDDCLSTETGSC